MKTTFLILTALLLSFSNINAQSKKQSSEVLFFKAKLCGCKAKSCNALENDIKTIIEKNINDKKITFRTISIADEANKELVEKYNAKSQTTILVTKKKKKEEFTDISDLVQEFSVKKNKEEFEKALKEKIDSAIK